MANIPNPPTDYTRVFTKSPGEVAESARRYFQDIRDGKLRSISWGVDELDDMIDTLHAKRLMGIVARPSQWKTGLMMHLARIEAERIMREGDEQSLVWFISAEEDEQAVQGRITRTHMDRKSVAVASQRDIDRILAERARWPVWLSGQSPIPSLEGKLDLVPAMTVDKMWRELDHIMTHTGKRPSLILVDYLQILEIDSSSEQRHNAVSKTLRMLKHMANSLGACVVVGCQAKERVDDAKIPVPQANDAYYSSEVLHTCDVLVSLMYPIRAKQYSSSPVIWPNKVETSVSDRMLWLQLLKQRNARGTGWCALEVDPVISELRGIYANAYPDKLGFTRDPALEGESIL